MKIGVDAGALCITDDRLKVGVYRVIRNLLRELSVLDTKNTYILYSFDPIDDEVMSEFGSRMNNEVLWPVKGWFRFRLPLELRLHPVNVFLGCAQAIPRNSQRTIGFVYDVGFLHHPEAYPGSLQKLTNQTKYLLKRADEIITISDFVKKDIMEKYHFRSEALEVAHPGVENRFTYSGYSFKHKHQYFLFVGALKPGKNVPVLIEAFAKFLSVENKPYDLLLVGGDFWKDKNIDYVIRKHNLQHRVKLTGYVTDEELPAYYRGAVSFVSPSLHEGFCLPAVEAMACGCPVIASTAGALPEIVGKAGILIDPSDVNGFARAMTDIAHNIKMRTQLVRGGITRSKLFIWKNFAKIVYKQIQIFHET